MIGRRSDLPPADHQPWGVMDPRPDSFYARLAEWRDVLVDDEDYAPLYKDSPRGRPVFISLDGGPLVDAAGVPRRCPPTRKPKPGCVSTSDGSMPLGSDSKRRGFDATVLCRFRRKLLECGLARTLFERLVNAAE